MGPAEMVVAIVAITAIASVIRTRHKVGKDWKGNDIALADPEADRLREEMRALKERVAVLERLATDDTSSLDREIERLRERDRA